MQHEALCKKLSFKKSSILYFPFLSVALSILLPACTFNTPIDKDLIPQISTHVDSTNTNAVNFYQTELANNEKWWLHFNDPQLNELVAIALANNQKLSATFARMKSSEALLKMTLAQNNPNLMLNSSANSDITSLKNIDTAALGLSSTWELDLWGGIAALEDKAQWDVIAKQAVYKTNVNTVVGSVAVVWTNWLAEYNKKRLYASQYTRTETALKVISRRYEMGKNSVTDIWQQKRLLESIISQQAVNQARLQIFEKQLALWLGITVDHLPTLIEKSLPEITPLPTFGLPLEILQLRPDIQQAYAQLQADNANLAAAITERFPRLSIRANYTTTDNSVTKLFDDWGGNLVASLTLPLIDSGSTKAKITQREYNFAASYADYQQTWLDAIYAVESTLITEQQLAVVATQLNIQLELAQRTERVMSLKYLNGKSTYLELLKAQETSLNLENQTLEAQKVLINNRIGLYRELSHGNFGTIESITPVIMLDTAANSSAKNGPKPTSEQLTN